MANRSEARVVVASGPSGLTVEIRPLVRTRRGRLRFALLAAAVLIGALLGASRIVQGWETSLRRGEFTEFPLPLLASLSLAIGVFAPLALVGLAALAFSEETVEVSAETLTIRTTAFEKTRIRRIPLSELECWRETYLPLAPWWTWAVQRLAARWRGRLEPLAGAAGPKEKREIARILARATGKPLVNDFGRARS
ncbi:MAG TPA: hypothetical protein VF376_06250 [Thermoanaerobaculia bacterium]